MCGIAFRLTTRFIINFRAWRDRLKTPQIQYSGECLVSVTMTKACQTRQFHRPKQLAHLPMPKAVGNQWSIDDPE